MVDVSQLLKLKARDAEDLAVISALLQDALVPPGDIDYLPGEASLVMAANRYRWEAVGEDEKGERILSGLAFAHVTGVQRRGMDLAERGAFYNLLSVGEVEGQARAGDEMMVQLTFSGGAAIRLTLSGLLCTLEDFGEAWPTVWRPHHD
ncbi:MAG: DUF2948 family protein [Alphaproteobacteria bacterium]|nr:DUF2948 family protein [Alphaproteobacteria bacterium]